MFKNFIAIIKRNNTFEISLIMKDYGNILLVTTLKTTTKEELPESFNFYIANDLKLNEDDINNNQKYISLSDVIFISSKKLIIDELKENKRRIKRRIKIF